MTVRSSLLSVLATLTVLLASCGTFHRAGKDALLGVGAPVLMAYGGATDGLATSRAIREGTGCSATAQVAVLPFTTFYHVLEHGIYGVAHLVDLGLCPLYGALEVAPFGPEIEPLDLYGGTVFDEWAASAKVGRGREADAAR